jgi:hypothetical protein
MQLLGVRWSKLLNTCSPFGGLNAYEVMSLLDIETPAGPRFDRLEWLICEFVDLLTERELRDAKLCWRLTFLSFESL